MATPLAAFLQQTNADNIRANNTYEIEAFSGYNDIDSILKGVIMYAKNVTMPGRNVEYASVWYKGFECVNLVPTRVSMETDHSMTVYADINGTNRRCFLAWQNKVMNMDIEGGSFFQGDRGVNEKSTIRIRLFDKDNETTAETMRFYNVTITSVGPVTLQYDGGDVATFDVGFKSTFWQLEDSKNGDFIGQK